MKFTVAGKGYDIDPNGFGIGDYQTVKRLTATPFTPGLGIAQFQRGVRPDVLDPDALLALVFIAQQRAGDDPDWDTLQKTLDFQELLVSIWAWFAEQLQDSGMLTTLGVDPVEVPPAKGLDPKTPVKPRTPAKPAARTTASKNTKTTRSTRSSK